MKPIAVLTLALTLCGCAYPVTSIDQGSAPAVLYVPIAPPGAALIVDGLPSGLASAFNGKNDAVLPVAPGKRHVVVRTASGVVFDKHIYVGAGSKVAVEIVK